MMYSSLAARIYFWAAQQGVETDKTDFDNLVVQIIVSLY